MSIGSPASSIPASDHHFNNFEDEKPDGTALVSLGAAASLFFLFLPAGLAFYTARFSLQLSPVAFYTARFSSSSISSSD